MNQKKVPIPLRLKETKVDGIPDLINWFFEYFIFFRWIYFKNRPRGNLLFLRSLMATSTLFGSYFFFFGDFDLVVTGIEIDPVIAWALATVVGYWNMSGSYSGKTIECSKLYFEYLRSCADGNFMKAKLLSCSLVLQVIKMDLWADRSYGHEVARILEEAIHFGTSDESTKAELFAKLQKGKLSIREARVLISAYREHLLEGIIAPKEGRKLHAIAGGSS